MKSIIKVLMDGFVRYCPKSFLPFCLKLYMICDNVCWRKFRIHSLRKYYDIAGHNDEIDEVLELVSKVGRKIFLYPWAEEKSANDVEVFTDAKTKLPYVLLDGKRLFYPRSWEEKAIKESFHFLQHVEQHLLSPHRYLSGDFDVGADDIVVDCGSAEGNFSLSVVDRVKRLYLFEATSEWTEPLAATFAPWKDKVEIIQKYVSDSDDETSVSLDSFFADKEPPTFLKMDVEGYEKKVLTGAVRILANGVKKVAVCAYHQANDEEELTKFMTDKSFSVNPAQGYMFYYSIGDDLPYFRRGVLRCTRQ